MALHNPAHWPEILAERFRERVSLLWRIEASLKGAQVHPSARLIGRPIISVARESRMELAEQVSLRSGRRSNPLGCFQPCVLRTVSRGAELVIGERVAISSTVICSAFKVQVGADTIMGAGAMVVDTDFHRLGTDGVWINDFAGAARPVMIGRSVFIGGRAIILKGVTIGDRSIVGAGAVVTRDVPPDTIVGGNPARTVRKRTSTHDVASGTG